MKLSKILKHCRVDSPERFRIADYHPAEDFGLPLDKEDAKAILADGVRRLADLQERLYAQDRWAVLVVLQAMDAAGKDSVIKHVMSGVNPLGCEVHPFKAPSEEELQHGFLWRAAMRLPRRGRIGIFNRSYYEEVLIVRVLPHLLEAEKLPQETLKNGSIWRDRFKSIRGFEAHLHRNGTRVIKFYLHISKEEQRKRLLARLDDPDKNWKFDEGDVEQRQYWARYMEAYEACLGETSTKEVPWHVVPADDKRNARLIVSHTIIEALEALPLAYPKVDKAREKELEKVRAALEADGGPGGR
jgi:PPK2 family polyphosphate:nucleotide phosphotransferase